MMRMGWKTVGAIAAGLSLSASALAAQQVEVGVRGGYTAATIAWSPSPLGGGPQETERLRGFTGGVTLAYAATDRLMLRAELLLTGKGFREIQGDGDISTLDLDYYEVPVFVGLRLTPGSSFSSELYAGPWISKERSCTASITGSDIALSFDCNDVPDDPVLRKTTDWGVAAGIAVSFDAVGPFRALFDARYTAGLRNIDGAPAVDNVNARHRGYAISAGVSLPVGS